MLGNGSHENRMGKKVFLIEDDEDIRMVVEEILTLEGFQVTIARDGQEALEIVRAGFRPDLMLLDLMMPRMDGFGFRANSVREFPEFAKIPLIIMSADGKLDEKVVQARGQAYMRKPMDLDELVRLVRRFTGSRSGDVSV